MIDRHTRTSNRVGRLHQPPAASDEWGTPRVWFDRVDRLFHFNLDPCAHPDNRLQLPRYFTKAHDGLSQDWAGSRAFMNPPFSSVLVWIRKAIEESRKPCTLVVGLVPARSDETEAGQLNLRHALYIVRPNRRVNYDRPIGFTGTANSAQFPSQFAIFGETAVKPEQLAEVGIVLKMIAAA